MFLATGCSKAYELSFAPVVTSSELTDDYVKSMQENLDNCADAPSGKLSFVGYNAYYNDEGSMIIDGFFRNDTGRTVSDISGTITIKNEYLTLAKATFTFDKEKFGELPDGAARPWTLEFTSDTVANKSNNIGNYTVYTDLSFTKK